MAAAAGGGRLTLVTGGARSGKSRYAESLITALPPPWVYIATAQAGDAEMAARIAAHQARRGPDWKIIEAPYDLVGAFLSVPAANAVLVDCLTLWLSNCMLAHANVDEGAGRLAAALTRHPGRIVLVTNEVGSGIVPDNILARQFQDHQGRLNQRIAALADRVVLVVAGLPLALKGST
jgi:adenosylcobinamide kinase / adenosylcobinamide-phosphate guanylyltransferase